MYLEKSDMWLPEEQERSVNDWHRLTGNKYRQVYYQINPDNPKQFRTVHWRFDIFANRPIASFTDYVEGVPPDGMPEMDSRMLAAANRFPPSAGLFN